MKPQHFANLALAAAVTATAAILVYSANAPFTGSAARGGKLVPDLAASADKIAAVEITQGKDKLTLTRSGETWVLKERDDFPASTEKVRALLVGLSEAELAEAKTKSPDRHALLELEEPNGRDTTSRLIRVLDASGTVLAETLAGKTSQDYLSGTQGTYVRKPGDPQTWLATTLINGGTSLRDWAQARVFETQTEKVARLKIELPGGETYDIKRDGDQHTLAEIPAGKKLKFVNVVDTMVEAASFLDFENVRKAPANLTEGAAGTATLEMDNGLKIAMRIRRDSAGTWATLDVSGEGDARKAADEIKTRSDGWEFEIMPSKANTLLKKRDDLLEDAAS